MQAHLAAVTAEHPDEPVMWCGDLNVAHRDMDLAESEKKRNKASFPPRSKPKSCLPLGCTV